MKQKLIKKTILLLIITCISGTILIGCNLGALGATYEITKSDLEDSGFKLIKGLDTTDNSDKVSCFSLYYYEETRIVYIVGAAIDGKGFCPFISKEGTYVRYVDGKLENVE